MKIHQLKTWPEAFEATARGEKTAEYRLNDRKFQKDDLLMLELWNPETKEYMNDSILCQVTHVIEGGKFDLPPPMVILSIDSYGKKPKDQPGLETVEARATMTEKINEAPEKDRKLLLLMMALKKALR